MHRLFVALRPPPAIRALLHRAMGGVPMARWQDDEQLHLTLRYVGEVDRRAGEDIALTLAGIHGDSITVMLAGVGTFDRAGRVNALWAGVAPHDALAALHRKVDRALIRLGLSPEGRAYLPHVTLARLPRSAGLTPEIAEWRARHAGLNSVSFPLDHLYLCESHLGGEGARYEAIGRWGLNTG